jgi:hypothetical protein
LQDASQVVREPLDFKYEDGVLLAEIELPPYAIAAITIEFVRRASS